MEGPAELIFVSPLYPPVKGLEYIVAGFCELDKVCFIERRILNTFNRELSRRIRRVPTLIMVRIMLTVAKAALAGVPSTASFRIFRASMVAFNEERATSERPGCWDFGRIVEVVGRNGRGAQAVWEGPSRDGEIG